MSRSETKIWEESIIDAQERLREPGTWYPFAGIISVALVLILIGHLFPGLNPRKNNLADVIAFSAPKEHEGHIWIGVFPEADRIVAVTSDHRKFSWPRGHATSSDTAVFREYLKERVAKEIVNTGRSMELNYVKASAVLAVDQRLTFNHIKPLLLALAEAKIAKYGFETKLIHKGRDAT